MRYSFFQFTDQPSCRSSRCRRRLSADAPFVCLLCEDQDVGYGCLKADGSSLLAGQAPGGFDNAVFYDRVGQFAFGGAGDNFHAARKLQEDGQSNTPKDRYASQHTETVFTDLVNLQRCRPYFMRRNICGFDKKRDCQSERYPQACAPKPGTMLHYVIGSDKVQIWPDLPDLLDRRSQEQPNPPCDVIAFHQVQRV